MCRQDSTLKQTKNLGELHFNGTRLYQGNQAEQLTWALGWNEQEASMPDVLNSSVGWPT